MMLESNMHAYGYKETSNIIKTHTHRHHNHFMALFRDYPGEPVSEENFFWTYGEREDNRGRHTDIPAGRHSMRTLRPTSVIPHFYAGCPLCRNPPSLS